MQNHIPKPRPIFTFATQLQKIPCQCQVLHYSPALPMRITGTGFGDADPPEPEEFDYELLDTRGHRARWLERKATDEDDERFLREYLNIRAELSSEY